jgi:hypothetical protein
MILYHGTNTIISDINLSLSRPYKDFGKAFYLSENLEQAKEIAISRSSFLGGHPTVNEYYFDESLLNNKEFNIKIFEEYSKEWAEFVLKNRNEGNSELIHNYDIVYGPIADDRVGLQIRKFIDKIINIDDLVNNLKYLKGISFQYAFCSNKSVKALHKNAHYIV